MCFFTRSHRQEYVPASTTLATYRKRRYKRFVRCSIETTLCVTFSLLSTKFIPFWAKTTALLECYLGKRKIWEKGKDAPSRLPVTWRLLLLEYFLVPTEKRRPPTLLHLFFSVSRMPYTHFQNLCRYSSKTCFYYSFKVYFSYYFEA